MKQMLATLTTAALALLTAPAPAQTNSGDWKGQVSSDYIRADGPIHVLATDDEAWTKAWRFKLDARPPRPLAQGETGLLLIAGPRPTPGYTVRYQINGTQSAEANVEAWVESPDVVMFPAGNASHPWRALILDGNVADVEVVWRE